MGLIPEARVKSAMSESSEIPISDQARIFKALNSEVRLRLLQTVAEEGDVSAPDVAKQFEITAESIKNNLNQLEEAGLLISSRVRGPGNRPRDEFSLPDDGVQLKLDVLEDTYSFELTTSSESQS